MISRMTTGGGESWQTGERRRENQEPRLCETSKIASSDDVCRLERLKQSFSDVS